MTEPLILKWSDVRSLAGLIKHRAAEYANDEGLKVYGVPRGGSVIASMIGEAVERPEDADVIVDDIIDSGATRDAHADIGVPFFALVGRAGTDAALIVEPGRWVTFPWERGIDGDESAKDNVRRLLQVIGEDPNRDGLKDTPARFIKALRELTAGYGIDAGAILSKQFAVDHDSMIVVRDVPFWSLCEHHLLPFHGTATVGYVPQAHVDVAGGRSTLRVVGLSKLVRLVHAHSRRLQVQERLTDSIADDIVRHLKPLGCGVIIRARHQCMEMRGVQTSGEMVTSSLRGLFRDDATARAEFLSIGR